MAIIPCYQECLQNLSNLINVCYYKSVALDFKTLVNLIIHFQTQLQYLFKKLIIHFVISYIYNPAVTT